MVKKNYFLQDLLLSNAHANQLVVGERVGKKIRNKNLVVWSLVINFSV